MPLQTPGRAGTLPRPPTPFIGRNAGLAETARLLADPGCRLLTLVGPGGIGKTRLAIEAAARTAASFADGVVFADLQPAPNADWLAPAIAAALKLPLAGQEPPVAQLCRYLADKELLLLDNFEHVPDGAETVSALLSAALRLKLLVTSRVALNVREEWQYPVGSLSYPGSTELAEVGAEETEAETTAHDAVQLFVACARRTRPTWPAAPGAGCRAPPGWARSSRGCERPGLRRRQP